jgi:hypothetical protein
MMFEFNDTSVFLNLIWPGYIFNLQDANFQLV